MLKELAVFGNAVGKFGGQSLEDGQAVHGASVWRRADEVVALSEKVHKEALGLRLARRAKGDALVDAARAKEGLVQTFRVVVRHEDQDVRLLGGKRLARADLPLGSRHACV
jgi:hypothetical protein